MTNTKNEESYEIRADDWKIEIADLKAGRANDDLIPNRFEYHLAQSLDRGAEIDNPEYAAFAHHDDEVRCAEGEDRLFVESVKNSFRIVPINLQDKVVKGDDLTSEDVDHLEFAGWSESDIEKLVGTEPLQAIRAMKLNFDESYDFKELLAANIENPSDAVFGSLRKSEGAIAGCGTGVGKSVFANQCAIGLACDRPDVSFGFESYLGPLRQLVIQAENDKTANAEAIQGISKKYGLSDSEKRLVFENVKWRRWGGKALRGEAFLNRLERAIKELKPRVVWIDPLIAYFDGSLRDDEKCMSFFYGRINEVMVRTETNIIFIHHTPKSSNSRPPARGSELAQVLNGSSYLANWAREVFILEEMFGKEFERRTAKLSSTKRLSGRAGFKAFGSDELVDSIVIQHGKDGVYWEQRGDPKQVKQAAKSLTPEDRREKFVQYFVESFDAILCEIDGGTIQKNEVWAKVKSRVKSDGFTLSSLEEMKSEIETELGIHEDYLNIPPPEGCVFRLRDANNNGSGKRLVERESQSES